MSKFLLHLVVDKSGFMFHKISLKKFQPNKRRL
jgi:hypothetical protein